MGIENLSTTQVAQVLNNSDVRTALSKKGIEVTEKSIFKVSGNSIQIDIEGDGVYDKTVSGLFRKDGSVNTNHKKIDVDDTAVNTSYIKQQNGALKQMETMISSYGTLLENLEQRMEETKNEKFDEQNKRAEIEQEKAKIEAELNKAREDLKTLEHDYENNHDDWTSKQCKEYNKKFSGAKRKISQIQEKLDNFDVEARLVEERQKFEQSKSARLEYFDDKKQEIQELKTKQEEKLHKAKHSYNNYLNKHGYKTTEARNNVKDLEYDENAATEKGMHLQNAETTEATAIRLATEKFKQANPGISNFDVKYDAQTGSVTILLDDGDTIADHTISGFYDPEKKTLNFDGNKLELSENATSTKKLAAADRTLKSMESKADAIDYTMNPDRAKAEYGKIDNFKLQMAKNGITMEALKEYRKQHQE